MPRAARVPPDEQALIACVEHARRRGDLEHLERAERALAGYRQHREEARDRRRRLIDALRRRPPR